MFAAQELPFSPADGYLQVYKMIRVSDDPSATPSEMLEFAVIDIGTAVRNYLQVALQDPRLQGKINLLMTGEQPVSELTIEDLLPADVLDNPLEDSDADAATMLVLIQAVYQELGDTELSLQIISQLLKSWLEYQQRLNGHNPIAAFGAASLLIPHLSAVNKAATALSSALTSFDG